MSVWKGSRTPFTPNQVLGHLGGYINDYHGHFQSETSDGIALCAGYVTGLLKTESTKRNLERINEEIDVSGDGYQRLQHFITDAPWSATDVMESVALKTSALYASQPDYRVRDVGYILDESAHRKKGRSSVGVARQYAGVIGKVDNCQVGVYASLVRHTHSTLINCRLFLPQSWTDDPARCEAAGVPLQARAFKTKLELALEMIQADQEAGVGFGWVGGDGFYGHGLALGNAIENIGLTFLLDVHSNQQMFTSEPAFVVPEKTAGRGRQPTTVQPDRAPRSVKDYAQQLVSSAWQLITVRHGTKGPLRLSMHATRVWVRDNQRDVVMARVLVISRNLADNKVKYSLSNVNFWASDLQRLAYMQAQRYWVERAFQEAKSDLGMSDYQVRKYQAWYHHMALVMMALAYIVKERIIANEEYPLLSCRDVRLLIIALLLRDETLIAKRIAQMSVRHEQRQRDIDRHYKLAEAG